MSRTNPWPQLCAMLLIQLASRWVPNGRREWVEAMSAELHQCESPYAALRWALGCVVVSLKERMLDMMLGDWKISRWVAIPEMLLCFVPLTIAWYDSIAGVSGLTRLNGEVIHKYFLTVPGGTAALGLMIASSLMTLLGPIALVTSIVSLILHRPVRNRWLSSAMVVGPLLLGALTLVTRLNRGGWEALSPQSVDAFDFWSALLLLSLLPSLGAAHLAALTRRQPVA